MPEPGLKASNHEIDELFKISVVKPEIHGNLFRERDPPGVGSWQRR